MAIPDIATFNTLGKLMVQKYERYLPTAFDESLTLLEKINKVIEYVNETGRITNELIEFVTLFSDGVKDTVEEFILQFGDNLEQQVIDTLEEWQTTGKLDVVINEALTTRINDLEEYVDIEFGNVNTQLAQTMKVVNVKKHGAIGDGVTLDYQSFKSAIDEIKSNGGGTLVLEPNKEYLLFNGQTLDLDNDTMFDMEGIKGFSIQGNGSTLLFDDINHTTDFDVFRFRYAKNIKVENIILKGNNPKFGSIEARAVLFRLLDNVTDVVMENITGENIRGFISCFSASVEERPFYKDQAKRIKISNIVGEVVRYGFLFPFNGSDVVIDNVKLNKVHRGYFAYGIKNHKVEMTVDNFDATGALIKSYSGRGCENIDMTMRSDNKNNIVDAAPITTLNVELAFGDAGDAVHKNIKIVLDVKNPSDKVTNVFMLRNVGTAGGATGTHSHILDGLDISGYTEGGKGQAIRFENTADMTWDNVIFKNINIHDLTIKNQGAGSQVDLEPLEGIATFKNIDIIGNVHNHLYVTKEDDGKDYIITFENCKGNHFSQRDFTAKASYINCVIKGNSVHNYENKVYENTLIGDKMYNRSFNNQGFDTKDDLELWWHNYPQVISRKLVDGLGDLSTTSIDVTFNNQFFSFPQKLEQPNVFRFQIMIINSTGGIRGYILGELLLYSNTTNSTALRSATLLKQEYIELAASATQTVNSVSVPTDNTLRFELNSDRSSINKVSITILI